MIKSAPPNHQRRLGGRAEADHRVPVLGSLASLVLDLSSVIVERSGLLPALLPGPAPGHLAAIPGPVQVTCPGLSLVLMSSILI